MSLRSRTIEFVRVTIAICAMLVVLSVVTEGVLRVFGYAPRGTKSSADPEGAHVGVTPMHLRDAALGWRNKPGSYRYVDAGREVEKNILADGSRVTPTRSEFAHTVLLIGDSFTAGAGLSDHETMAWRLQTLLPQWRILNLGVGGYGSCQSWVSMISRFAQADVEGATVVYGFNDFHEGRNVAFPAWDYYLAISAGAGHASYPYCELDSGGRAQIRPPRSYALRFPGAESSAFLTLLERGYLAWLTRPLVPASRKVTEQLLVEMRDAAARRHGKFIVLFMAAPPPFREHYRRFFEEKGIEYIEGSDRVFSPDMKLQDNHPNAAMNELWANQLAEKLSGHY